MLSVILQMGGSALPSKFIKVVSTPLLLNVV